MEKAKRQKIIGMKKDELQKLEREVIELIDKANSLPPGEQRHYTKQVNDAVERMKKKARELKKLSKL